MRNQKRTKQRVPVTCNEEDYTSKLPNNILANILSSVRIIDAVRTSVLSPRWRHIYANPTNLTLDAENMLKIDHSATNVWHQSEEQRFQSKCNRALAFVSNVNQYLPHVGQVQKIVKFKVEFTFGHNTYGSNDLDEWISFAMRKKVEAIDLCLLEDHPLSAPSDGSLHIFPCDDIVDNEGTSFFKSYLKCLRLTHCVLAPHKFNNSCFSALTTMELIRVDLKSEEHILILLSSCNNLEWLRLSQCYNMEKLIINHPFCQKLKYLNVNLCHQLKALVIHSISLEALEYRGSKIEFEFDAPRLRSFYSPVSDTIACHKEVWPVFKLPFDLPQMETLIMECGCSMGEVMTKSLPKFPCLRQLQIIKVAEFRQDISWIARILESCPMLGRLELHLRIYSHTEEELRKTDWPNICAHNHLKEVVISGFRGHASEIEIAIYLLRNAIALEKMTIDPRTKNYLGNGKWDHSKVCDNWSKKGRQNVDKHLKQETNNSTVKLLIK